jgi:hypothetical protein
MRPDPTTYCVSAISNGMTPKHQMRLQTIIKTYFRLNIQVPLADRLPNHELCIQAVTKCQGGNTPTALMAIRICKGSNKDCCTLTVTSLLDKPWISTYTLISQLSFIEPIVLNSCKTQFQALTPEASCYTSMDKRMFIMMQCFLGVEVPLLNPLLLLVAS